MSLTTSSHDPAGITNNTGPNPSRRQRLPILVGISGKRIFDKANAKTDESIAAGLADRFRILFETVERAYPETPKIVLTGAAFGADLVAAEAALQCGESWSVVAVLPFDRVLFEEDFRPFPDDGLDPAWRDRYAEHARSFARFLDRAEEPSPRVLVRELPRLALKGGGIATAEQLTRHGPHSDKTLRRNHYEQVGQFIAEISTIFIAVMGGSERPETSAANGGTARIVAYRRAGRADATGTEVARRSSVLRAEWPEAALLPAGYVWLMDPGKVDYTDRYPVKVLPPLLDRSVTDIYAGYPGRDLMSEQETDIGPLRCLADRLRQAAARVGTEVEKRAASQRLRASLVLANGFERYHKEGSQAASRPAARWVDLIADTRPTDALASVRALISSRQRQINSQSRSVFHWLARLFVLAVLSNEIFAKFSHDRALWLGVYLGILTIIGIFAFYAQWMFLDAVAEDYRAVAETLRVQRAWWSAGLTERVDREHLQGVDQDLAPIRDCAKTIIAWNLLRYGWQDRASMLDWAQVRGTADEPREMRGQRKPPEDWIGSQLWFFANNAQKRERRVRVTDAASWCLFVTSGALGGVLWTWLVCPNVRNAFARMAHIPYPSWVPPPIGFDVSTVFWILAGALVILFRVANHDIRHGPAAVALTGALGGAAAVALALGLMNAGPMLEQWTGMHEDEAVRSAVLVGLVGLSAIAGAWRYLTERLNVEAEALEYRDARGWFERAERSLARGSEPGTGAPADAEAARRLVYQLGRLALAENEAWLKSRRERPLTPVVG
jgi:hypothetical protein